MLVVRDELDESSRAGLEGLASGSDDLEVYSFGGAWSESADLPGGCLANADFSFTYTTGFFVCGDSVANEARDFEFFCGLKQQLSTESKDVHLSGIPEHQMWR